MQKNIRKQIADSTQLSPPNVEPKMPVRTAEQPAMMYAMAVRDRWLALIDDLAMDYPSPVKAGALSVPLVHARLQPADPMEDLRHALLVRRYVC